MCKFDRFPAIGVALFAVVIAVAPRAEAQSLCLPPGSGNQVALEVLKVSFDDEVADVTFGSTVWFLSGQLKATPGLALVGEIPLSRIDVKAYSVFGDPDPETAVGNPYIGVILRAARTSFVSELGLRLPVASEDNADALVQGIWSDADRWEAFIPDLIAVRARAGMDVSSPMGTADLITRFRIGPTLWIPTEDGADAEIFADATASLWFQPATVMFGVTLSGRTLLSEDALSFSERSEFQFGLDANVRFGNVRPGVHFHMPLGDDGLFSTGEAVDFVFGLNVTMLIPGVGGI